MIATTLLQTDLAHLERDSWVDAVTAAAWGVYRVSSAEGLALVGRTDREDYSGIVFPVYWPGDPSAKEHFLRRDHPSMEQHGNGTLKAARKYLAPPGRGNRLLFGPAEAAGAPTDTRLPIVLVEGLKKAVAAWRLSRWESETPRFLACGLTGVWNFRGTIGRTTDHSGARVSIKGIIPDLDRVTWAGRMVFLIYDSDALTNMSVLAARETLAEELRSRGAQVVVMFLPTLDGLDKTGFDDLLARWGPQAVLDWLQAGQTGAAAGEDPDPILLDALDVPPFPTRVIPSPWLRDMIDATGAATETPVELPLMLSLGVVATCVQRKYAVEPEPGYTEPTNLWMIPALESGSRKSAVVRDTTAPLLDFERDHATANAQAFTEAGAARRLAEDRVKHLRQKAARAEGADLPSMRRELFEAESAVPDVPTPLRLWAQDITPEKLGQLMADHGEKMAILSDEGGIFDILGGRYNNGVPNLDLFLQAHSGAAYRVDRGSRPSVFLDNPALTLVLSPQPSVLRGLAAIPGFRGRGLLARPLYALPQSTLGRRTLTAHPIPETTRATYHKQIHALLTLPPRADGAPHLLRFSDPAYQEWKNFQRHVEVELRDGGTFEHIRDWAGKLPGSVARLAGVLHCAEHAADTPEVYPIDLPTMEAALTLGGIFERHALAAFGLMAVDSTIDAAQKVWTWVLRYRLATFSKRDCFQGLKGSFPDMESLQPALNVLLERGYLFPLPIDKRVGRPSPRFRVNQQFAKEW